MIVLTAAILLLIIGIGALLWSGIKRIGDEQYCAYCRFELTGIHGVERCPECGTRLDLSTSKIIGKRNQRVFRLGLVLIVVSLPFFLLRFSQTMSMSDRHKPLWWLRAEYAFVHQNDWRYFNELKRRLDAAVQTTGRESSIAAAVLEQADALEGQPFIRDAVVSAYRHITLTDRSDHIGALVQTWVDGGLNTRSLAYMNLSSYLQQVSSERAIEPLVKHLENQRATLSVDSTRFEIRQALGMELIGLVEIWWQSNGQGTPLDFQNRIRGEPVGISFISPTVISKGEEFEMRIGPRFVGLTYEVPGWSHARVNEIRFNGDRLETEYPIEFSHHMGNPAGAWPYMLDLGVLESGIYDMEIDTQVLGSPNSLPSESEWEGATLDTIKGILRVMPNQSDVDVYWASKEIRQAAHDAVSVRRLNIATVELHGTTYDVWDLAVSITNSPVNCFHDTYIEQGDQTWKLDQIYVRAGVSDVYETNTMYLATTEGYARLADPPLIRRPIPSEPVIVRLVPNPDLPMHLSDAVWPYEVELGPIRLED